jgi:hypothetical protein
VVVQLDNETPIVLNLGKSVTHGIRGMAVLPRFMKLSSKMGKRYSGAASRRTKRLGAWKYRNGCSINPLDVG